MVNVTKKTTLVTTHCKYRFCKDFKFSDKFKIKSVVKQIEKKNIRVMIKSGFSMSTHYAKDGHMTT